MDRLKKLKTALHFKKGDYVYRFILVDRFKHTSKVHYGWNPKEELTEEEIWQITTPRKLRRKYILKENKENG